MRFPSPSGLLVACLLCRPVSAADQVLMDFEKPRDVNAWEVKSGPALALSTAPVLAGKSALQVGLDAKFSTTMLPRDWSAYSTLSFSYFHELKTPVALTVSIGDLAWLDSKSLWNQHNQTFLLQPGKGVLSIPVREMFRGQGDQKFLDLKTNLDPASIMWMEIEIRGGSGTLYLDDLALGGGGVPSTVAPVAPKVVALAPAPAAPAPGVPPAAAPAAVVPPAPAAGTKVLVDFENIRDLGMWEQRTGAKPMEMVKANATSREQSLRIVPGTLIITESITPDWTGFAEFAVDFFVEGEAGATVEVMIGDNAWIGHQVYFNRHNSIHKLRPGANTVKLPLADLFRGEPGRRNITIKRNIDIDQIAALSFTFTGRADWVYVDNLRLQGQPAPSAVPVASVTAPTPGQPAAIPAPAAPAAPTAVAADPGGDKVWMAFESAQDIAQWEVRAGPQPEITPQFRTQGNACAKVFPSNLLAIETMPRDWSPYETLALDVINPGQALAKVEVLIGDDAWISAQNYWNRHNSIHAIAPGTNTLEISLANLYRGEASARNRGDIKRNIDLNQINFLSLTFLGKPANGPLYLDNFRLTGRGAPAAVAPAAVPVAGAPAVAMPSPVPRAPAAPAAPVAVAAAGQDKVLFDFEDLQDVAKFEVRTGPEPSLATEHATRGAKSLKASPENLLATYEVPRDWRPYEALEIDVFNAGTRLAKLELLIGDDAWTANQNYWNRHNAIYAIPPGENTITIPVGGLYRGEASARNRGEIKRNMDLDQICFISFNLIGGGGPGTLFLDNIRLKAGEGGGASAAPVPGGAPAVAPAPAAPAAVAAPAPAAPAPGGVKRFFSFEDLQDVAKWETRTGKEPELSDEHATDGKKSLKFTAGTLLATYEVPRDWSPYQELLIDVFNPAERIRKIELLIGDDAWIGSQNYWNRHNSIWSVAPGQNTLRIGVQGLYRGESGARNRGDIKRNIDSDKIGFMSLNYLGDGVLYLDNLRLSSGEDAAAPPAPAPAPAPTRSALPAPAAGPPAAQPPPPAAVSAPPARAPRVWGFDFGPPDQAVWPGFRDVSWNTVYDASAGYGLERAQAKPSHAGDTGWPTRLLQDYVWIEKGEFLVDLPAGEYTVDVYFEESGYWSEEQTRHTLRAIIAEGVQVVTEDRKARGARDDALHLFQDVEPGPGVDMLAVAFERLYQPRSFTTKVTDGQLNLGFYEDARQSARVAGVVVTPLADPDAARWRSDFAARNLREARSRMAAMPIPPPRGYEGLPEINMYVFAPTGEDTPGITTVPKPGELIEALSASGTPGEVCATRFALHARDDLRFLTVEPVRDFEGPGGARIPATNLVARAVRYYARRDVGDPVYQVVPWHLVDAREVQIPKGTTRLFWLNLSIPPNTPPGEYAGMVKVQAEHRTNLLPITIRVRGFTLDPADVGITFFGMPRDSLEFLAGYGLTSACGGPHIEVQGWDKEKNPQFFLRAANDYIQAARRAGITREILDYGGPITITGLRAEDAARYFHFLGDLAGLDAATAAKKVFERLETFAKANNWGEFCLNLVDEPLNRDQVDNLLRSIDFLRANAPKLRLGGFFSFNINGDALGSERLFHKLDVTITKGYNERVMKVVRETGKKLYLYSLGRSRYTFGPALYQHRRNGVSGYVEWHCSIIHGYQFFDLDGREPDVSLIMYCREGIRPTLDLERIRQGIYDLRYLITLENRVAKAKAAGKAALAKDGEALLANLLGRLNPGSRIPPGDLDMDRLRADVAAQIEKL